MRIMKSAFTHAQLSFWQSYGQRMRRIGLTQRGVVCCGACTLQKNLLSMHSGVFGKKPSTVRLQYPNLFARWQQRSTNRVTAVPKFFRHVTAALYQPGGCSTQFFRRMAAALHQSYLSTGRAGAGGRPGRGRRAAAGWGGRGGQALGRGRERLLAAAGGLRRAARPGTGGAAGGSRLPGSDGGQRAPHGAAFFFFLEPRCYLSEEVHLELYIDKSRGAKLKLATGHNTCVFIDCFRCSPLSDLSVDAMDITGEQQQDVEHKPFKRCLDKAAHRVTPEVDIHESLTQRLPPYFFDANMVI
ncbi:uncharacterized protein LOC121083492 [Falco naumanni]|uniref:uncharacterized protein LOC121083492 n=1 Tax=Falco naumanni TaxID=148594 RepID=UPI001ADDFE3E|nr:uncharacterized protein LOC121083492 [Falco naumanni]